MSRHHHHNQRPPMIPPLQPAIPPGGVLLQKATPAAAAPRSFVILIRGATDGWNVGLNAVAVKGVSALEAQTIIAWVGDERLALTQPVGQITEDGRIVPAVIPQGDPTGGGGPGPVPDGPQPTDGQQHGSAPDGEAHSEIGGSTDGVEESPVGAPTGAQP